MRPLIFSALGLCGLALMLTPAAYAAAAQHWSSREACAMATKAECVQDTTKGWRAAETVRQPVVKKEAKQSDDAASAPVTAEKTLAAPPAAMPVPPPAAAEAPVPAEPVKPAGGFFTNLFGGKKAVPTPAAKPAPASPPDAAGAVSPPRPPEPERPPVDPEVVLRGRVWTSEAACKKEALKGKCSSIDCATHSGGACTGYTSMIWIYR